MMFERILERVLGENGLVWAFLLVGVTMLVSGWVSRRLTFGRVQGSAIAILLGLCLAWVGGVLTGGKRGLADVAMFGGVGLMGGSMMRDFAIVATAFEVEALEARRAGWLGAVALLLGTVIPFSVGVTVAWLFGYRDSVDLTTIGAGAVTYIVGPVTGGAIGASPTVMAVSIATGVFKAIMVMVGTPLAAGWMGLRTPRAAMVFGGLAGTVSGVSAGLAATDRRLVPYGALVATFHTGLGCLMGPSVLYFLVRRFVAGVEG
jgi:malonate transporter MadM subunit